MAPILYILIFKTAGFLSIGNAFGNMQGCCFKSITKLYFESDFVF
jgi:hypothetical protein